MKTHLKKNLVVLPDPEDLNEDEIKVILRATWYELNGWLLVADVEEIKCLSEYDPVDCGVDVETAEIVKIDDCLKRVTLEDGFYHA